MNSVAIAKVTPSACVEIAQNALSSFSLILHKYSEYILNLLSLLLYLKYKEGWCWRSQAYVGALLWSIAISETSLVTKYSLKYTAEAIITENTGMSCSWWSSELLMVKLMRRVTP